MRCDEEIFNKDQAEEEEAEAEAAAARRVLNEKTETETRLGRSTRTRDFDRTMLLADQRPESNESKE